MKKIRLGLMGFGEIPRHIYRLCLEDDLIEVVAISEIGKPEILHYLLVAETKGKIDVQLDGNFLVSKNGKARFVYGVEPGEVPWDIFNVDFIVDSTGKYKSGSDMQRHINAGAKKVILSNLPNDKIDRIVVMGVNEHTIKTSDKLISAGSATTNATAIMLKIFEENFGVDYAMLTTVHSYTSDQPLRDKASDDYRRSRSAAENIIPNETPSPYWIQKIMPEFKGRIEGYALNVPIPNGSLLDLTTVFKNSSISINDINIAIEEASKKLPDIIQVENDPIVSTDVIGNRHSVVYDKRATMHSPIRMVKTLTWYHAAMAMAARIIDIMLAYNKLSTKGGVK
jgi:glyceraldehyde 3-phosphate dehydrogenase